MQIDPRALRRFKKNKGALAGLVLVVLVTLTALVGPFVAPHDPERQYVGALDPETGVPLGPQESFVEPASEGEAEQHLTFTLGADHVGRDELSRLLHGGAVSMQVAFFATGLAVLLGLFVGVTSGYFGGGTDLMSMRVVDVLQSLPFLLVCIAVNRIVDKPDLSSLYLLLGFLSWTSLARVTRTKTMQVRELEFVQAARALGASEPRILFFHVLPNVLGPAIVIGTTLVAQMIIVESAMSFLGVGVQPPTASWGSMLHDGQDYLSHEPRYVLLPAAFIVAAVFGFNLLGEGLRDAIDPKA